MGYIRLLEDDVINKIAAGEVVERPASVVKELIDNAIDAGATRIRVELEQGGTERVTVIDNGRGMGEDDALLAVQRHATSKISCVEDLMAISTMGFRGEALASIASVSRFVLQTQTADEGRGCKITIEGGSAPRTDPWSGPAGTAITVSDLFYNVPARKAFLKSPATELAQCVEIVQSIAIMRAGVEFVLVHNGKERLRVDPGQAPSSLTALGEANFRQRVKQALNKDYVDELIYIRKDNQYGEIEALISSPGHEKPTGKHVLMFVNERPVKDKHIRMGVMRGYHSHLLKGQYPIAIISLRLNPSLVDVNVHPAKTEIRLQYATDIQALIAMAIREKLRAGDWARPDGASSSVPLSMGRVPAASVARAQPSGSEYLPRMAAGDKSPSIAAGSTHPRFVAAKPGFSTKAAPAGLGFEQTTESTPSSMPLGTAAKEANPVIPWSELDYIGSLFSCYLVFDSRDRMLIVDQHAFHERIIYERLVHDRSSWTMPQPLLVPEAVDLDIEQMENLKTRQEELIQFGFRFECLANGTVEWKAVPSILTGKDLEALTHKLAAGDDELDTESGFIDETRLILATIACHSAVRAGDELTDDQLRQLFTEAAQVDFYHNCPHGRRVFRWWSKPEVERWFDR